MVESATPIEKCLALLKDCEQFDILEEFTKHSDDQKDKFAA